MKNRKVAYVVMTLALAVAVFLAWLLLLPAINLQDPLFWTFVVGTLFIWGILASAIEGSFGGRRREDYKAAGIAVACGVGIAAVGLLIALASSVVFHAKTYAGIMAVTEKEAIADDLPSAETTSSIALMDTDSAAKLGDRKIGSLAEVVSQYDVSGDYSQIAYQDEPLKVSALEYAGIIKYFRNREREFPDTLPYPPARWTRIMWSWMRGCAMCPPPISWRISIVMCVWHIRLRFWTVIPLNLTMREIPTTHSRYLRIRFSCSGEGM